MSRTLELDEKLDLLFEYGEAHGISSAYRTIADATGENATNIRKIHKGKNINPGIKILTALVDYFEVDLGYFSCKTKEQCEVYLARFAEKRELDEIKLRADGVSAEGLFALRYMFNFVRKAEGLPPVEPAEADEPGQAATTGEGRDT